ETACWCFFLSSLLLSLTCFCSFSLFYTHSLSFFFFSSIHCWSPSVCVPGYAHRRHSFYFTHDRNNSLHLISHFESEAATIAPTLLSDDTRKLGFLLGLHLNQELSRQFNIARWILGYINTQQTETGRY